MTSQDVFIQDLRDDAANGRIAFVLGTGFSAAATENVAEATWVGLLRNAVAFLYDLQGVQPGPMLDVLDGNPKTPDLLAVAQWVHSTFQGIPGEYANWLERTVARLVVTDRTLLEAIPDTDHILTTNYDTLWSERFTRKAITWTEQNSISRYARAPKGFVYHLHGVHTDPKSVILSGQDYGRLAERGAVSAVLRGLATSHSLVLLGYGQGLDDPDFGPFMEWLAADQSTASHRHYLPIKEDQLGLINLSDHLRARVTPIVYGTTHADLPGFLRALPASDSTIIGTSTLTPAATTTLRPAESQEVAASATGTIEGRLLRAGLPAGIVQIMQSEGQLGPFEGLSAFQKAAMVTLLDLVEYRRPALFFTVTGTGKTTLARVAMNLAVARDSAAVSLMPTKALVAQELAVWRSWAEAWEAVVDRRLRVYGSSRDYPESDRPVSRGRFDVAIAIYEKLALYLVTGRQPLTSVAVIVVDELQILTENSDRAAKLEALLTMLCLLPPEDRPTLLGLSPSLRPESTQALQSWLGVSEIGVVQTNERPVPLDAHVVSQVDMVKQTDAHLVGMKGRIPPPPSAASRHDLAERMGVHAQVLADRLPTGAASARLAAVLVDSLLADDASRKIVCFVPTRAGADALAGAIQALLRKRAGRADKGSPWSHGRFASTLSRNREETRYVELKNSALPSADDVISGLREGVAAHSATYPSVLRRLVEDEFRREDGLLRVIVATDTLAMGVNLPADTVIATSIFGYSGEPRSKRLLSASNLANKAGRAGRLGKTSRGRGEFYIIVPNANEIDGIHGLTNADILRLSTSEGVLEEYVTKPKSAPAIQSNYRTQKDVASLALQILCQDRHGRSRDNTLLRITEVLEGMLSRHEEDAPRWEPGKILDELVGRELIGVRAEDTLLRLSGLGMAIGTSSLDLDLAPTLERIARLSTANAGRIDVLWNACRSSAIQSSTPWISLPPVHRRHLPSMRDAVLQMATAYCSDSVDRRRLCAQSITSARYAIPSELVEAGSPVVSPELAAVLALDGEHATDVDITALLRALVINEWSLGIPFNDIKARFTNSVMTAEDLTRGEVVHLQLHYSDVEQLCDQVAGVLRGAASLAIGDDGLDYSTQVSALASEVEIGAPSWLTPLLRMRLASLHRERLSFLWNATPPAELVDVLAMPEVIEDVGVVAADVREARRLLELRMAEAQATRNRVAQRWSAVRVPRGEGDSFSDVSDELDESNSSAGYAEVLSRLMENLGVSVQSLPATGFFIRSVWTVGNHSLTVFVPHGDLAGEAIEEVRSAVGILVARTRLTESGRACLRRPHQVRIVEPEHLLTLVAQLVESRGPGVHAEEVLESFEAIRVSSIESENWSVYDGALRMPPPFVGTLPKLDRDVGLAPARADSAE